VHPASIDGQFRHVAGAAAGLDLSEERLAETSCAAGV
jgi:hypothetical protein